jgi:NAD(P)-dependent dehydrogenase (short-subunit alcohol dehydrogenase family)
MSRPRSDEKRPAILDAALRVVLVAPPASDALWRIDRSSLKALAEQISQRLGTVSILVNSAVSLNRRIHWTVKSRA